VTSRSVIQERLRGNVETYTSKVLGSVVSRGTYAENVSSVQLPIAQTQLLPQMLPPVPTLATSISGPKPIVTAGMAPVAGGVTLLPLSSFRTPIPTRFNPAFQQFLRLHARTDDFETTVGKAWQYMDMQEQDKTSAIAKKTCAMPVVNPNQIKSNQFWMGYKRFYKPCLKTRTKIKSQT